MAFTINNTLRGLLLGGVLALVALPAFAVDCVPPNTKPGFRFPSAAYQKAPSVPYSVEYLSEDVMNARYPHAAQGTKVWGITHWINHGKAAILYIRGSLTKGQKACTLIYEKAHLPPNLWYDVRAESPATIKYWESVPGSHIER